MSPRPNKQTHSVTTSVSVSLLQKRNKRFRLMGSFRYYHVQWRNQGVFWSALRPPGAIILGGFFLLQNRGKYEIERKRKKERDEGIESDCKIFWVYLLGCYKWGKFRRSPTRDRKLVTPLVESVKCIYLWYLIKCRWLLNLIEMTLGTFDFWWTDQGQSQMHQCSNVCGNPVYNL